MSLQIIKDGYGNNTGVFVPMTDWDAITQKHQDLKELLRTEPELVIRKTKLSELAGTVSNETAEAMLNYAAESRIEWEERMNKQV